MSYNRNNSNQRQNSEYNRSSSRNNQQKNSNNSQSVKNSYYAQDDREARRSGHRESQIRNSTKAKSQHSKTITKQFKEVKSLVTEKFYEEIKEEIMNEDGGPKVREAKLNHIQNSLKDHYDQNELYENNNKKPRQQQSYEEEDLGNLVSRDNFNNDEEYTQYLYSSQQTLKKKQKAQTNKSNFQKGKSKEYEQYGFGNDREYQDYLKQVGVSQHEVNQNSSYRKKPKPYQESKHFEKYRIQTDSDNLSELSDIEDYINEQVQERIIEEKGKDVENDEGKDAEKDEGKDKEKDEEKDKEKDAENDEDKDSNDEIDFDNSSDGNKSYLSKRSSLDSAISEPYKVNISKYITEEQTNQNTPQYDQDIDSSFEDNETAEIKVKQMSTFNDLENKRYVFKLNFKVLTKDDSNQTYSNILKRLIKSFENKGEEFIYTVWWGLRVMDLYTSDFVKAIDDPEKLKKRMNMLCPEENTTNFDFKCYCNKEILRRKEPQSFITHMLECQSFRSHATTIHITKEYDKLKRKMIEVQEEKGLLDKKYTEMVKFAHQLFLDDFVGENCLANVEFVYNEKPIETSLNEIIIDKIFIKDNNPIKINLQYNENSEDYSIARITFVNKTNDTFAYKIKFDSKVGWYISKSLGLIHKNKTTAIGIGIQISSYIKSFANNVDIGDVHKEINNKILKERLEIYIKHDTENQIPTDEIFKDKKGLIIKRIEPDIVKELEKVYHHKKNIAMPFGSKMSIPENNNDFTSEDSVKGSEEEMGPNDFKGYEQKAQAQENKNLNNKNNQMNGTRDLNNQQNEFDQYNNFQV